MTDELKEFRVNCEWTDAQIVRLKALYADGWSMRDIAHEMGVTRNSVAGKVDRLNLPPRRKPGVRRSPIQRAMDGSVLQSIRRPRRVAAKPVEIVPTIARKTLLELESGDCRWPVGDPLEEDFGYCALPTVIMPMINGKMKQMSYCACHYRISYRHDYAD
jgi:GcrA cell cycle regulator